MSSVNKSAISSYYGSINCQLNAVTGNNNAVYVFTAGFVKLNNQSLNLITDILTSINYSFNSNCYLTPLQDFKLIAITCV